MLLFPLVTFGLWIVPIVEVGLLVFQSPGKHNNIVIETFTQVAINLQGLMNCIILVMTNTLVRHEITRCCCHIWCCGRRRGGGGGGGGDFESSARGSGGSYLSYGEDDDEFDYGMDDSRDRFGNHNGGNRGGNRGGGHGGNDDLEEPLFMSRRSEPAYSEDVSITRFGPHVESEEDGGSVNGSVNSYEGGGVGPRHNMTTPVLPSLNGSVQDVTR